jgi:hypothetical protein
MTRGLQRIALSLILVAPAYVASAQGTIPLDVQAEHLNDKIHAAYNAHNFRTTAQLIQQYHDLHVRFPPPLWYVEADAWHHLGDNTKARKCLEIFMRQADRKSALYWDAAALYVEVEK